MEHRREEKVRWSTLVFSDVRFQSVASCLYKRSKRKQWCRWEWKITVAMSLSRRERKRERVPPQMEKGAGTQMSLREFIYKTWREGRRCRYRCWKVGRCGSRNVWHFFSYHFYFSNQKQCHHLRERLLEFWEEMMREKSEIWGEGEEILECLRSEKKISLETWGNEKKRWMEIYEEMVRERGLVIWGGEISGYLRSRRDCWLSEKKWRRDYWRPSEKWWGRNCWRYKNSEEKIRDLRGEKEGIVISKKWGRVGKCWRLENDRKKLSEIWGEMVSELETGGEIMRERLLET